MEVKKETVINLSMEKVNKQVMIYTLLLSVVTYIVHLLLYEEVTFTITFLGFFLFLVSMVLLTVLHEAIHLFGFRFIGGVPWKDLAWGVNWKLGVAYAHSKNTVTVSQFKKVLMLPFLPTGLLPLCLGIFLNFTQLTLIGVILTVGCIGDVIMYRELRAFPDDATVLDHSTKPQFTVFE